MLAIAALTEGFPVAVEILSMRLFKGIQQGHEHPPALVACGRQLLSRCEIEGYDQSLDHNLSQLVKACLIQSDADTDMHVLCERFFGDDSGQEIRMFAYDQLLAAMFNARPFVCLDAVFADGNIERMQRIHQMRPLRKGIFNALPFPAVMEWAQRDPATRFPIVAMGLRPLKASDEATAPEWSDAALAVLDAAPDRMKVMEAFAAQFVPTSWTGSRATIIENRRALLRRFFTSQDAREVVWARENDSRLSVLAEQERASESQREQRFE